MTPVDRVGGRVLMVDPDRRVLLIHERIENGTHWLTPGGGVEDGEHPRAAAVREAYEETGVAVTLAPDVDAVHVTRRLWSWAGLVYDQVDHFYLARVPAGLDVRPTALTELERVTVLGHRWWSLPELRDTDAVLLPADLAEVLAGALARSSGSYDAGPNPTA